MQGHIEASIQPEGRNYLNSKAFMSNKKEETPLCKPTSSGYHLAMATESSPYPPSVQVLIEQFAQLPGIGKRSAERMAYHVLTGGRDQAMNLAFAIRDVKKNIRACEQCFNVAEDTLCAVCADPKRDASVICVVELPRDIIAIEKTSSYRGVYHVLQGRLSPVDGIGPEELRIRELHNRIEQGAGSDSPVRELVLALNPTTDGDATASYLAEQLARHEGLTVTRLARGLASGTELENTAPSSLQFAFEGRRKA